MNHVLDWRSSPDVPLAIPMTDLFQLLDSDPKGEPLRETLAELEGDIAPPLPESEIARSSDVPGWKSKVGVYALFVGEQLLYIGMTTDKFNKRVTTHARRVVLEGEHTLIVFPDGWHFLVPALEAFLIQRLRPPLNV